MYVCMYVCSAIRVLKVLLDHKADVSVLDGWLPHCNKWPFASYLDCYRRGVTWPAWPNIDEDQWADHPYIIEIRKKEGSHVATAEAIQANPPPDLPSDDCY
jgi:hypothetical protein